MKQVLQEAIRGSLNLVESAQPQNSKYLGTLKGVCADYKNATRNGNFYSRKLWENVFNDPLVKEALEDKVLLGELDHPCDGRLETLATNACIAMTDYEFDDANQVVIGTFDILPTEKGKLLKSLLDYGCKIGVSSRGEGDVTTDSEGRNVVAEDGSYYFVAFDAVVLPAVKSAKPALQESIKRGSLKESIKTQIDNASTIGELNLIKQVIEATEIPSFDSLLESINIKSKELEGDNNSSNLLEDLETMTNQIQTLVEENRRLKKEVTNSNSRVKRLSDSYFNKVDEFGSQTKELNSLNESLRKAKSEKSSLLHETRVAKQETSVLNDKVGRFQKKLTEMIKITSSLRGEIESLKQKNSQKDFEVKSLKEALSNAQTSNQEKVNRINRLQEQLRSVQAEKSEVENSYHNQLNSTRKEMLEAKKSLSESQKREQSAIMTYAEKRSKDLGVDSKRILESVQQGMKTSDVDKLIDAEIDRLDRYRKLPVADSAVAALTENVKVKFDNHQIGTTDEELAQSMAFMEQYYNRR